MALEDPGIDLQIKCCLGFSPLRPAYVRCLLKPVELDGVFWKTWVCFHQATEEKETQKLKISSRFKLSQKGLKWCCAAQYHPLRKTFAHLVKTLHVHLLNIQFKSWQALRSRSVHGRIFTSARKNMTSCSSDSALTTRTWGWYWGSSPLLQLTHHHMLGVAGKLLLCCGLYPGCFHSHLQPHKGPGWAPLSLWDFISYCTGGGKDSFYSGSWAGQGCGFHCENNGLLCPPRYQSPLPHQPPCHLCKKNNPHVKNIICYFNKAITE